MTTEERVKAMCQLTGLVCERKLKTFYDFINSQAFAKPGDDVTHLIIVRAENYSRMATYRSWAEAEANLNSGMFWTLGQ